MNRWQRIPSLIVLLFVLSVVSFVGCSGSSESESDDPGAELTPKESPDAQAWSLGNKLSLAAVGSCEQAAQSSVNQVMAEASQIAAELGVELAPLPARKGTRAQDAAATLNYLLKIVGPSVSQSLDKQHGRRASLLFQTSLKTNLLLLLYSPAPDDRESLALVDFLSQKATEAGLPANLWNPLVNRVRSRAPFDQVKSGVRVFQGRVLAHLEGGKGGQAATPATAGAGPKQPSRPVQTLPDAPSPATPLGPGEQYLRELKPQSVVALPEGAEHKFDRKFEVQKTPFENGVYFCPPTPKSIGRASFELAQGYSQMKGGVAISDHRFQRSYSPVTFRILADGKVVWSSRPLQVCGDWEAFDVNLAGVKQLTLEVECTGLHTGAHGSWMDPKLVKAER